MTGENTSFLANGENNLSVLKLVSKNMHGALIKTFYNLERGTTTRSVSYIIKSRNCQHNAAYVSVTASDVSFIMFYSNTN